MEPLKAKVIEGIKSQMNQLYHSEIHFINTIQKAFVGQDKIFISSWISRFGEPSFIYFILFSVLVGLRHRSGVKFLGAVCFNEWLNFVLKVLLLGDRPYWWIKNQSPTSRLPYLSQVSMICKSDPGNPSSFLQMNTVVWYILIATLNDEIIENSGFGPTSRILLRRNMWKLYGVFLIFLFISEVVTISNFPHQSIFGVVCGIFVINRTFVRTSWMSWGKFRLALLSGLLVTSCFFIEQKAVEITGHPFTWPLPLAKKGCNSREGVIVDPMPLLRIVQMGGSALGLALSIQGGQRETRSLPEALFRSFLGLLLGLITYNGLVSGPNSPQDLYLLHYFIHGLFTYACLSLIPKVSFYLFTKMKGD